MIILQVHTRPHLSTTLESLPRLVEDTEDSIGDHALFDGCVGWIELIRFRVSANDLQSMSGRRLTLSGCNLPITRI